MNPIEKGTLMIVLGVAGLIYLLPLAAGIYFERQDRKKRGEPDNSRAQYDERQKLLRLKAGNHALYVLGGYLLVWLAAESLGVLHGEYRTIGLLAGGLMLAFTVWNGECILRGAMLGYNQRENEAGQTGAYLILGFCWTCIGWMNLDGVLGMVQRLMGGSWLILGVLMLCARHKRKLAESRMDGGDGDG